MQTILAILNKAGGWHPGLYLKIDNPPYMELVIEAMDESGPMGLPALSIAHYWRTERRPHARPGDVLRTWRRRGSATRPLVLAQRLCCRRAVEPQRRPRPLRAFGAIARAARPLCRDVGQQPAFAGLRRGLQPEQAPTRLDPIVPPTERTQGSAFAPQPHAVQPARKEPLP